MRFSFVSFLIGVLVASGVAELMKPEHQKLRRSVKAFIATPFQNETIDALDACEIPIATKVPQGAVIVVGHAYGSPQMPYEFLGDDFTNFVERNKTNIAHVILTGDVFAVPSKKRWQRLKSFFAERAVDFTVAPGNHDVDLGDNTLRDVFLNELGDVHKRVLVLDQNVIIVEDSTRSNWRVSDDFADFVQQVSDEHPTKHLSVVRHHIPVVELERFANSNAQKSDALDSVQSLAQRLGDTDATLISGDSGAFARLPRSSCHSFGGLTFYLNGLGGVEGDEVLILHDRKISRLQL